MVGLYVRGLLSNNKKSNTTTNSSQTSIEILLTIVSLSRLLVWTCCIWSQTLIVTFTFSFANSEKLQITDKSISIYRRSWNKVFIRNQLKIFASWRSNDFEEFDKNVKNLLLWFSFLKLGRAMCIHFEMFNSFCVSCP